MFGEAMTQAGHYANYAAERSMGMVRNHPGMALLTGFGLGFAFGLIATALIPERRRPRSWMDHPFLEGLRSMPEHLREMPDRVRHWPESAARSFASVFDRD